VGNESGEGGYGSRNGGGAEYEKLERRRVTHVTPFYFPPSLYVYVIG
jgi:hypothetical protein